MKSDHALINSLIKMMQINSNLRTLGASLLVCLILPSCAYYKIDSLKNEPFVLGAKRIGVSQAEELNFIPCVNANEQFEGLIEKQTPLPIPQKATARAIAAMIRQPRKVEIIEPLSSESKYNSEYKKKVLTLTEKTPYDIVIHVMAVPTSTSNGYYNVGAGVYVPGGTTIGGYFGRYGPFTKQYLFGGRLLVRVYRGSDGVLFRQCLIHPSVMGKREERQKLMDELLNQVARQACIFTFGEPLQ